MATAIAPITGVQPHTPTPAPQVAPAPPRPPATPPAPAAAPANDTVQLSVAARARLFNSEGESVNQIATNLEVTSKVVESYLGKTQLEAEIAAIQVK